MSSVKSIGNTQHLNKEIPKNPKYEHIKTKLDTGCSLSKHLERELNNHHKNRKDELFKRLKETTFAKLVLQVASIAALEENETEDLHGPEDSLSVASDAELQRLCEHTNGSPQGSLLSLNLPEHSSRASEPISIPRSTLHSLTRGFGELDIVRSRHNTPSEPPGSSHQAAEGPYVDSPYLLLDVRDREQYDQCHIISAHNYPIISLRRTMNPYTKEVLDYKNTLGKIIILYDEDERIATQAATTMCQRGFENLYVLSGGLKAIAKKLPEGMTTGSLPASCIPSSTSKGKKCLKLQQPSVMAEKRWRFTPDELSKIQQQLDDLSASSDSSSRLSSRLSSSSSLSTASSARSKQSSLISSRVTSCRPWK